MSPGKSAGAIAEKRGWPSSGVRQRDAALKRQDPAPRCVGGVEEKYLTPELLDEIREFIEEEHGRISVKIVSNRFTVSRTSSRKAIRCLRLRPLVIRRVLHLKDRHIRDRRKFVEEMLARLALGSGRRISRKVATSRRLDSDVICFTDEKIFRVDAAAPGRNSHTFYCEKWDNVTARPPFSGDATTFEPLYMTHPSEVGSTFPLTLLAAMLPDTRC